MITVRAGRAAERDTLFEIWERAVYATHDFISRGDLAMYSRLLRNDYLPRTPVTVAADEQDTPLGFMGITGNRIEALFVAPERHGEGVGRLLVESALRRVGWGELFVDVNEQNDSGRRFYAHMGFRPVGRSPFDGCGRPYPILHLAYGN